MPRCRRSRYEGGTERQPWISRGPKREKARAKRATRPRAPSADGGRCASCSTRRRSNRSEEHTSELQSLMRISYAVFCLKKKTTHTHVRHLLILQLMRIPQHH